MDSNTSYALENYFNQVLGLSGIPLPSVAPNPALQVNRAFRLTVLNNPNEGSISGFDLFYKMMAAIGVEPDQIDLREFTPAEMESLSISLPEDRPILCFDPELFRLVKSKASVPVFSTFSPIQLSVSPQLKRQAWEDLKLVFR